MSQGNKFRVGDQEYAFFAIPLTDGGWTTKIVYTFHAEDKVKEQSLDSDRVYPSKEEALAAAEAIAHDLAKRHTE